MSDYDKSTCPVCFTRMRNINRTLTCPECGYKYCDHNRDRQDMFGTTHTHAPNYTTYTNNTASSTGTTSNRTQSTTHNNTPNTTYTKTNTSSGRTSSNTQPSKKSARKVVKIIIIIYLIIMFCPIICGVLGTIITAVGTNILAENVDDYEGQEIIVAVEPGEEASIDIDSILANIDVTTPASIEYQDGEFVTELIKHIFNVSDCEDVTAEEFGTIYWLEIYRDSSDCLYANYYFNDGGAGSFDSDITEIRGANLNAFVGLELLDSPNITYEAGDLKDLKLLRGLACKSTPMALINVISSPEQLNRLHLTLPPVSDTLEGLQYFSELQTLEISAQNSSVSNAGRIADLDKLDSLTYIDAGELWDFSFLSDLPTLNSLTLSAPSLPDLNFVYNMPELQNLSFYSSDVTDLQPLTAAADTLTSLDMSFNTFITDYSPLTEMTNLRYLTMDYCDLTDVSFASELENLTQLSIQSNQITSLEPLKDLPYLTCVQTYYTPIVDYAGLEGICEE